MPWTVVAKDAMCVDKITVICDTTELDFCKIFISVNV